MTLTNVDKNPYKKPVGFITLTVASNDNSKMFEFGTLWVTSAVRKQSKNTLECNEDGSNE